MLRLCAHSGSLEREVLQTFFNVYQYSSQRMRSPITMSVATTHIRITGVCPKVMAAFVA
jgi:hypothetical protein